MDKELNGLLVRGLLAASLVITSASCIPTHEKLTNSSTPIEVQPFQEITVNFVHHWDDNRHPFSGATSTVALAAAAPAYANELPATVMGTASEASVTLATTGNPDPLQAELGDTVMSSEDLQMKIGNLLDLEKQEHLAPKALVTPTGETYAMVAPTITNGQLHPGR